jgi:alpha-tubulin suppressor-like RCC1 family protein
MAAAGRTHSVGLTKEGTVVCAGSQAACAVEGWSDIKSVYAGNAVTIGLNSAGQVLVSGSEAESLQGTTGIASVAIGETQILLVGLDGNVRSYALGSTPASDTSGWRNIVQAAAGSDYAAGLDQDGRVQIITDDPAMEKAVGSWTNIRYIAGKGDTLIAYDRSGKMYGFGTNTSDRYEDNTVIEEDPEVRQVWRQCEGQKPVNGSRRVAVRPGYAKPYQHGVGICVPHLPVSGNAIGVKQQCPYVVYHHSSCPCGSNATNV